MKESRAVRALVLSIVGSVLAYAACEQQEGPKLHQKADIGAPCIVDQDCRSNVCAVGVCKPETFNKPPIARTSPNRIAVTNQ